tara:strand:- start:38 stop:808 length:771 start_codon:yes stop_codon:yes gene_type:complete
MEVKSSLFTTKLEELKKLSNLMSQTNTVFLGDSEKHTTTIDKKWTYYINNLGFRNIHPREIKEDAIGIFGCSNIFGVGVEDHLICSTLLQKEFPKKTILNFGVMGASTTHIAKLFLIATQLFKIKTAFFSLPAPHRILMINDDQYYNLHPGTNSPIGKDGLEKRRNQYYQSVSEKTCLMNYLDMVDHIILTGKAFDVDVYFSSYDPIVNSVLIKNYNYNYMTTPMPTNNNAADNRHPCYLCHKNYAITMKERLLNV